MGHSYVSHLLKNCIGAWHFLFDGGTVSGVVECKQLEVALQIKKLLYASMV